MNSGPPGRSTCRPHGESHSARSVVFSANCLKMTVQVRSKRHEARGPARMSFPVTLTISAEQTGLTLAALLRALLPDHSWNQVRRVVETRRVRIGGELCLDPAR